MEGKGGKGIMAENREIWWKAMEVIRGKEGECEVYGYEGFDVWKELKRLKGMMEIAEKIGEEGGEKGDYIRSSISYKLIVPRANALILYVTRGEMWYIGIKGGWEEEYRRIDRKWRRERGEERARRDEFNRIGREGLTEVEGGDGSKRVVSGLEYLYNEIKVKGLRYGGRYYIHDNIQYIEEGKKRKAYNRRARILESAVWWGNQMMLKLFNLRMIDGGEYGDIRPKEIIFSTMPSSGKSYLCNTMNAMFMILRKLKYEQGGVLRVGNQEENILGQSRQTKSIVSNLRMAEIYPELSVYKKSDSLDVFEKSSEAEWGLKGVVDTPDGSIFKTRDSSINSIRCILAMMDDPSRGQQEATNLAVHTKICNIYNGDFKDRFDDIDERAIMLTGTMFAPFDVFSTEIEKALGNGYEEDKRFKNTYISANRDKIVIINDCEDEEGNSAYPEFISNSALREKRESLPEYDYRCIWRQRPIPAEGLLFAREYLTFYEEMPEDKEFVDFCYAYLDPTRRKARDYLSMPIFRWHKSSKKFYLVGVVYQRQSILTLYPRIVKEIIQHRIIKLGYEENTDTSLGMALQSKLQERNVGAERWCRLIPDYATVNKQQRITSMADIIKEYIVFPSPKLKDARTEIGFAVHQLMEYDGNSAAHDDFPDSLAGFVNLIIVNSTKQSNKIESYRKLPF